VGADDPTTAWRTMVSGKALLRLEEALVPFGEGPQLRWNHHGLQDRAFFMVDLAPQTGWIERCFPKAGVNQIGADKEIETEYENNLRDRCPSVQAREKFT
jgi:hypothetical protein